MTEPDFAEPAHLYGIDECEIAWRTPHSIYCWWELTEAGIARARAEHPVAANARPVLRLFKKHPGSGHREHRDFVLSWHEGHQHLPCTVAGATVRVALGLLTDEGFFISIAHSSVVRVPPGGPDHDVATRFAVQELVESSSVQLSDAVGAPGTPRGAARLRTVGIRPIEGHAPAAWTPAAGATPNPTFTPHAFAASSAMARKETRDGR